MGRGNALLVQILDQGKRIPPMLQQGHPSAVSYAPTLFNFAYFGSPEAHEQRVEGSPQLTTLDDAARQVRQGFALRASRPSVSEQ